MMTPALLSLLLPALSVALPASSADWVSVVPSLVKIRPGALPPGTASASLHTARGECEAFQVLVKPPLQRVSVERARVSNAAGQSLPLTLFREEFIEVDTPSNLEGAKGLWPDPLLPFEVDGKPLGKVMPAASTSERPLIVYAEVCVPESTSPGTFTGKLVVSAEGHPAVSVPVTLEVEPFTLPATSSLRSSFGISMYTVARGHGLSGDSPEALALLREYVNLMLAHRLSAHGMSLEPPAVRRDGAALRFDFSAFDREVAPLMEGTALPSGARFTSMDIREHSRLHTDAERVLYYRAVREHFAQKGWTVPLFYYAQDEPKPKDIPTVRLQSRRVREAGGLSVLVTAPLTAKLQSSTDIFCPVLNCFFPRGRNETCDNVQTVPELRARIAPSAHIWWYQSCMSHGCAHPAEMKMSLQKAFTGWASYMVDAPAPVNRAMGPLAFLAGVEGELYFDVTAMYGEKGKDPWKSLYAFGGNGDGTLFYPGTPERLGTSRHVPVPSLRLKAIRDGLEDYEYLRLLERSAGPELAHEYVKGWVRSGYELTRDPSAWEANRDRVTVRLRQKP